MCVDTGLSRVQKERVHLSKITYGVIVVSIGSALPIAEFSVPLFNRSAPKPVRACLLQEVNLDIVR
jgi:hypothetical protein